MHAWSPCAPINAEGAVLTVYHVTLFDSKLEKLAEAHLTVKFNDSSHTAVLLLQLQDPKIYNISIIAENKCGQMNAGQVAAHCNVIDSSSSNEHAILRVYSSIIMCILCAVLFVYV